MALLLAGPGAIATWTALAHYETVQRGSDAQSGAVLPVLMHASASRLHAEREIAFFFDPKDAGPGATAPPTISLAAGADRGPDVIVGRQVLARWAFDVVETVTTLLQCLNLSPYHVNGFSSAGGAKMGGSSKCGCASI